MNATLTVIAFLGLGALLIGVYVFAASARNFMSEEKASASWDRSSMVVRQSSDRRQSEGPASFPAIINNVLVMEDRRRLPDRRRGFGHTA